MKKAFPWFGSYLIGHELWMPTKREQDYSHEQFYLLVLEQINKERRKFERLKRKFSRDIAKNTKHRREPLPEDVRMYVWRRDQGKCVQCGSQEKLEYDHIIPVSKGGSSTARNIQLLCEECNRKKSNRI